MGETIDTLSAAWEVRSRNDTATALAQTIQMRGDAIRLVAEILKLIEIEGLAGADELESRVCASASFLLGGHPDLQAYWADQCVKRFAIGGNAADTAMLRK